MNVIRARLTFANVMSCLAVFIALGGSSYAAVKIKKNSIGSAQIKNNSIRSKDVRNKSLLAKDFKAGQLPAGASGPRGLTGAQGPRGLRGGNAASSITVVRQQDTIDNNVSEGPEIACPAGSKAVGGGGAMTGSSGGYIVSSAPVIGNNYTTNGQTPTGWSTIIHNDSGSNSVAVSFWAVCAKP